MKHVKTLSVALMAIGLSAPVLADSNATFFVPSQHGGFKIAIDPLYLRNSPGSSLGDSSFEWGVFAQVGYLFPQTGNDLTVDYTYLRSGDDASMDLDTADLQIGQRLSTGAFDVRLFSGIRYAHLNSLLNISTPENPQSLNSLFHGFGPQFGVDARYALDGNSGFGVDAHLNTAFLVGKLGSRYQSQTQYISESMNRVVPELDAKLGIDYTYPMSSSSSKSALVFELGYQTSNYVHALNSSLNSSGDANLDGVYLDVKYYS